MKNNFKYFFKLKNKQRLKSGSNCALNGQFCSAFLNNSMNKCRIKNLSLVFTTVEAMLMAEHTHIFPQNLVRTQLESWKQIILFFFFFVGSVQMEAVSVIRITIM